jgi:hypothetical protein
MCGSNGEMSIWPKSTIEIAMRVIVIGSFNDTSDSLADLVILPTDIGMLLLSIIYPINK